MISHEAAVIQLCSGADPEANVSAALNWCLRAIDAGAELLALPEGYAGIAEPGGGRRWAFTAGLEAGSPIIAPFLELSDRSGAVIVLGGAPELTPTCKMHNTLLVLEGGRVLAHYRKVHLFQIKISGDSPIAHDETKYTVAGEEPVVVDTRLGCLGLSICYDLRFPEHYRALVDAGAEILLAPSAFTVPTGAAHWELLTRTRAVESQCFLIAPAQWGEHGPKSLGRASYGHSIIVDPWGEMLARRAAGPGFAHARLSASRLQEVRGALPALQNRRLRAETIARRAPFSEGSAPA